MRDGWAPNGTTVQGHTDNQQPCEFTKLGRRGDRVRVACRSALDPSYDGAVFWLNATASHELFYYGTMEERISNLLEKIRNK